MYWSNVMRMNEKSIEYPTICSLRPYIESKTFTITDENAAENGLIKELVLSKRFGQDPKLFTMRRVNKLNGLSSIVEYVKKQATNT